MARGELGLPFHFFYPPLTIFLIFTLTFVYSPFLLFSFIPSLFFYAFCFHLG